MSYNGLPITHSPAALITACECGAGETVGLPTPDDLGWAAHELETHVAACALDAETCSVCRLLQAECPECGRHTAALSADDRLDHLLVPARDGGEAVALGCEGFATAALRAAAVHVEF